jgi:hypothetical protein
MDLQQIKYRLSEAPYLGQDVKRGLLDVLPVLSRDQLLQLSEMLDTADKKESKIKESQEQLALTCIAGFTAVRKYAVKKAKAKVAIVREEKELGNAEVDAKNLLSKLDDLDG